MTPTNKSTYVTNVRVPQGHTHIPVNLCAAYKRHDSRKMYTPSRIPSPLCLGTSGECAERDGLAAAAVDDSIRKDSSGRADNLQRIRSTRNKANGARAESGST